MDFNTHEALISAFNDAEQYEHLKSAVYSGIKHHELLIPRAIFEDVFQDAVVKYLRRFGRGAEIRKPFSFFVHMVQNEFLAYLRSRRSREKNWQMFILPVWRDQRVGRFDPGPPDELLRAIDQEIALLSSRDQAILQARITSESYEEAFQAMGLSRAAFAMALERARSRLWERLARRGVVGPHRPRPEGHMSRSTGTSAD